MRLCPAHWTSLREAIDDRGLTAHVAPSGAEAARRLAKEEFEPLVFANAALMANALLAGDKEITYHEDDGSERCPLCYLKRRSAEAGDDPDTIEEWIDLAADEALAEGRKSGVL